MQPMQLPLLIILHLNNLFYSKIQRTSFTLAYQIYPQLNLLFRIAVYFIISVIYFNMSVVSERPFTSKFV
jgi:hypothetical protein